VIQINPALETLLTKWVQNLKYFFERNIDTVSSTELLWSVKLCDPSNLPLSVHSHLVFFKELFVPSIIVEKRNVCEAISKIKMHSKWYTIPWTLLKSVQNSQYYFFPNELGIFQIPLCPVFEVATVVWDLTNAYYKVSSQNRSTDHPLCADSHIISDRTLLKNYGLVLSVNWCK